MSHLFSPPAAGLRRIILDYFHLMKCSAEKIHKYRVEFGFFFVCFLFSCLGWDRSQEGRDAQALKTGAKIKFLIQKVTSISKKTIAPVLFWKKRRVIVSKNKDYEETAQQIKLKKTDITISVKELKDIFYCSYIISPSLFFKWPF